MSSIFPHGPARDRKRRPTVDERRAIFVRADGRCSNCGGALGHDYHNAHLAAWSNGGATNIDNVEAQCMNCNLLNGATDLDDVGFHLRAWQADALPIILERIWRTGVATVNAAPGAGKTYFALSVFAALAKAGFAERLIVVSPNRGIVDQWKRSAGTLRIHLDDQPRDGYLEHPTTQGAIVTYQGLQGAADPHRVRINAVPTMVAFDEVHHIGENKSWGEAVARMVGDVANGTVYPTAVLNMTGTLFRSGRDKRISTVSYRSVVNDEGVEKLEAQADWSISSAELIGDELRPPDLYIYKSRAELMDLREEKVITGDLGDLDKQQRSVVLRGLDRQPEWLRGFAGEAVRLLNNQLHAIDEQAPLKLLWCATDQTAARLAADAINDIAGRDFARLVVSDEPDAVATLRRAAAEPRSCAIVQVKMAAEGFDCPEVATIAYASNVAADLSIAQTMARAMRITRAERAIRRLLPAQILIPDNPGLRQVFASVLATLPRLIDLDGTQDGQPCPRCGEVDLCSCRSGETGAGTRMTRYQLMNLSAPILGIADVLGHDDGEVFADELVRAGEGLLSFGIPECYHPRAVVWQRGYRAPVRRYAPPEVSEQGTASEPTASSVIVTEANPRDLNRIHRSQIATAAGWFQRHVEHDTSYDKVAFFQADANRAAGIPSGGRDRATTAQLQKCARWMRHQVAQHCERHGEAVPSWALPDD